MLNSGRGLLPSVGRRHHSNRLVCPQAKKGAQKKGSGALAGLLKKKEQAAQPVTDVSGELASPEQYKDPEVLMQLLMITQGYKKQYNEFLMEAAFDQLAEAIYKAPFALLAHNSFEEGVTDPKFTYANKAALELFEGTWNEIVGLPSRLSAEENDSIQAERQELLKAAADGQVIKDYGGWRKSLQGKRFKLKGVKLFNFNGADGEPWGQAAVFKQYETEDGTVVTVQGEAPLPSAIEIPPSHEEVDAAAAAVAEQAAAVRALKEQQGLGNQEPQVQEAVSELQQRKQTLADLQARYQAALDEAEVAAAAPPTIDSLEDEE